MWEDIGNWEDQNWFNEQYNNWPASNPIYDQQQQTQDVESYGSPGNWYYQQQPATTTPTTTNTGGSGSFWDQLLKLTPSLLGTGVSAYGASQAKQGAQDKAYTGSSSSQTTQQWAPGTLEYLQSLLGSATERLTTPATNELQQSYWANSILPYLTGTDPYTQTAGWAQNQMYNPGNFMPEQWGEAEQSLANQQQYAKTQLPGQLEQLTGWDRGNRGRVTAQENDLVANFLNQLETQKQGLFTQEAAAQAQANVQKQQAMQFGATMYPQVANQGTTAGLSLLGYPEDKQKEQWIAQMQSSLLPLLNILTGHPAGTTQTGTTAGTVKTGTDNNNSLWTALAAMAQPIGTSATNALLGQPATSAQPTNDTQSLIALLSKLVK